MRELIDSQSDVAAGTTVTVIDNLPDTGGPYLYLMEAVDQDGNQVPIEGLR